MSDGEVWWIEDNEANKTIPAEVAKHRYVEVMRVEDHERVVAEKDAEIERLKRANQVVPKDAELLALNGKFRDIIASQKRVIEMLKIIDRIVDELKAQVSEQAQTIATQRRVIAILKACILREDFRCGRWPAGREAIDQAESVERGER